MERDQLRTVLKDYGNVAYAWAYFEQGHNEIKGIDAKREEMGRSFPQSGGALLLDYAMRERFAPVYIATAEAARKCKTWIGEYRANHREAAETVAQELDHMERECTAFLEGSFKKWSGE